MRRLVHYLILIIFACLLIYSSLDLPKRGDAQAVMNRNRSPADTTNAPSYYIKNAYRDAHTPNMVTVILADYRGYDTLGEETVILTAGLICFLILRRRRKKNDTGQG